MYLLRSLLLAAGARGVLGRPDSLHHPQRQGPRARGRHALPPRVGARGAPSEIDASCSTEFDGSQLAVDVPLYCNCAHGVRRAANTCRRADLVLAWRFLRACTGGCLCLFRAA